MLKIGIQYYVLARKHYLILVIRILAKCHIAATLLHVTGRVSVLEQNIWIRLNSKKHGEMVIINVADS